MTVSPVTSSLSVRSHPVVRGVVERLQARSIETGAKDSREIAGASHALSVSQPEAVTATILDALGA